MVSDSDVIIYATKLGVLWVFKKLYGRILVPEHVLGELSYHKVEQISIAVREGIIEVRKTNESRVGEIASRYKIHSGEANEDAKKYVETKYSYDIVV